MARSLRDATDGSPSTTATSLRPSRVALATTLKPEFANEAGLHAVGAREADKQAVMGAHDLLADLHLDGGEEIGVFRKLDDDGAGELGEVAGRGDLALVGEAVDVGEVRARHAEMLRRLVHARDERVLAAGDRLGDHDGDVVGRLDDEHLERDVERDRAADRKPELARRLLRRLLRAGDLGVGRDRAGLQRLEGDVGRHQLGQRCREPLGVGILGVQDGAVIGLEDESGAGGSAEGAIKIAPTRRPRPARLSIIPLPLIQLAFALTASLTSAQRSRPGRLRDVDGHPNPRNGPAP